MRARLLTFALAVFVSSGCYHAIIETGRPASTQTIKVAWAHGWLWGLVPPAVVNTASRCPSGVAKVETQLGFLNQLAQIVTFGIYSPMQIDVTCASSATSSADASLRTVRSTGDASAALLDAARLSAQLDEPVLVRF